MYVILIDYTAPLDRVDELLAEHVAWLDGHYDDGTFLASGRREPRTGGVILARDLSPDALDAVLAADPFARHAVAAHTVVRFHASKLAPDLAGSAGLLGR